MTTYTLTEIQIQSLLKKLERYQRKRQDFETFAEDIVFLINLQPNTQWQDLTVLEQAEATSKFGHVWSIDMIGIADAISAKLQEKNGHLRPTHGVKP